MHSVLSLVVPSPYLCSEYSPRALAVPRSVEGPEEEISIKLTRTASRISTRGGLRRQNHVRILGAQGLTSSEVVSDVSSTSSDDIDARSDDSSTPNTARSVEEKETPRLAEHHRLSMKNTKSASQPTLVSKKEKSSSKHSRSKRTKRAVSDDAVKSEPELPMLDDKHKDRRESGDEKIRGSSQESLSTAKGEKEMPKEMKTSSNAVVAALQARRREREAREATSSAKDTQ